MSAPTTRPAPIAMKNASSPYQNEPLRLPVITAATIASTNVTGRRMTAAVHRMRSNLRRGGNLAAGGVQRRHLRDRGDAADPRDRRRHVASRRRHAAAAPVAVVPRLCDELPDD